MQSEYVEVHDDSNITLTTPSGDVYDVYIGSEGLFIDGWNFRKLVSESIADGIHSRCGRGVRC